jgi:hypothetical protein
MTLGAASANGGCDPAKRDNKFSSPDLIAMRSPRNSTARHPAAAVLSSFQRVNGAQHLSRIGLSLAVL